MAGQLVRARWLVVRWDKESTPIENGALLIEDGVVRATGPFETLRRRHPESDTIGNGTHIVMPGFVNAHSHGRGITTLRQGIPDEPGEVRSVGLRLGLSVDPYWDVRLTCAQQLEGGITSTMHLDTNYGFGPLERYVARVRNVLTAYNDSGMRFSVALACRDPVVQTPYVNGTFPANLPEGVRREFQAWETPRLLLEQLLDLYDQLARDSRPPSLQLEPANLDSCTDEFLIQLRKEATGRGARIQLHLLETAYQKAHSLSKFGKTGVERLAKIGFLGPDVTCAHCVWTTEQDISILRDTGAIVAHNPSSNLRLRSGLAPIRAMVEAGVPVALGIDNLGLNDNEDMLQEVRLAQLLHSPPGIGDQAIAPETALHWATTAGARVVGIEGLGQLEVGSPADLVMAHARSVESPQLGDVRNVASSIVQWLRQSDIDQVMVAGKTLVRGGRYTLSDRDEIARKAHKSGRQWAITPAAQVLRQRIIELYKNQPIESEPYYRLHSRN